MTKTMPPSNDSTPKSNLSTLFKTNASINMDNIVSVFITKYEKALYERKEFLSNKILRVKKEIDTTFKKELEMFVNLKKYNTVIHPFEINVKSNLNFDLETIVEKHTVKIICNSIDHSGHFSKEVKVSVSSDIIKKAQEYLNTLTSNTEELTKILYDISSISRKEREVRGKIAEKALRETGFNNLFDDAAILSLIELPALTTTVIHKKK